MKSLAEYLEQYKDYPKVKPPPHWKADIVNQIVDLVGVSNKFAGLSADEQFKKSYIFWLVMIKRSKKSWGDCMEILKTASQLPEKYSKAGYIVNQFKPTKTLKLL